MVKEFYVTSHRMLETDFMFGITGCGAMFSLDLTIIPDYGEWYAVIIHNRTNFLAGIRFTNIKSYCRESTVDSMDVCIPEYMDITVEINSTGLVVRKRSNHMSGFITSFRKEYNFLSNFYACRVEYNCYVYNSVEAAFQAQKCPGSENNFRNLTEEEAKLLDRPPIISPSDAKKAGKKVPLRSDWEDVKVHIMFELLVSKFTLNPDLKRALIATGDSYLVEGNTWHDNFWGACTCSSCQLRVRRNNLGELLMKVRQCLAEDKNPLEVLRVD